MAERLVVLNTKRERIRIPLERERIAAVALRLACRLGRCFCFAEVSTGHPHRNDRATAYCTHYTVFVATKWFVILSAEHERIRIPLERERIATAVYTASQ